jgi:hypothetical protein
MEELVHPLGREKQKDIDKDFDSILDKYRKKAMSLGYKGELRFKKEKGKGVIFVVI